MDRQNIAVGYHKSHNRKRNWLGISNPRSHLINIHEMISGAYEKRNLDQSLISVYGLM